MCVITNGCFHKCFLMLLTCSIIPLLCFADISSLCSGSASVFMVDEQNVFFSASQKMNATLCDSMSATMFHLAPECHLNGSLNHSWPWSNRTAAEGTTLLPTFTTAAKVRVAITWILCVASAFCNLAVLWAAHSDGRRKSHVRMLIVNLTLADLLVTFIVMPVDAVWNVTVQWLAGDFACRVLMFLKLQAMYSCAFVTVVISLDRQSAILNPLAINEARQRNKLMLTVAWIMSFVLSVPQVRDHCLSAHKSTSSPLLE